MKKYILMLAIPLMLSGNVLAHNGSKKHTSPLATAKLAGMCGALKQMAAFQEATKMEGGKEFYIRFVNTEAIRVGLTLPEFLQGCQQATRTYAELIKQESKHSE